MIRESVVRETALAHTPAARSGRRAPDGVLDEAHAAPAGPEARAELQSFEEVLSAYEVELYRYLRRLTPTVEDAADLHQDTFLRAFRAYGRLGPGANVRAWLYRIAGNLARDAHRRRLARGAAPAMGPGAVSGVADETPGGGDDPAASVEAAELRDVVRATLLRLTPRQRLAVMRRTLDGDGYADVATALGCSEETARQHVSQGLRRMRRMLERWMEGEE